MNGTLLGVVAAIGIALVPAAAAGQPDFALPQPLPQTRDRLPAERREGLVRVPIEAVQTQGLEAGKAAFDRLLARTRARHGARSVEVADLLESFGVGLYQLGMDFDDDFKAASIPYLEAAVPAYRAAFGDAHPEVALALNSLADVLAAPNQDDPPQSAETALEEAYRIRLNALGPRNIETLANLRSLARLRGLPSRTHGDRARIEAAAEMFRRLVANSADGPELGEVSAPRAFTAFARMYARNGMAAEAREQLRLGIDHARNWGEPDRCVFAATETADIEEILAGKAVGRGETLLNLDAVTRCVTPDNETAPESVPVT